MANTATLPELHVPVVNRINQAITNELHVACETNIAAAIKSKQNLKLTHQSPHLFYEVYNYLLNKTSYSKLCYITHLKLQ